jgi:23S rRNA (cytosine1962-C5)-methyltransferase
MEMHTGTLVGEPPGIVEIDVAGLHLGLDLLHAHKTGLYLDQLPHYASVAAHASGRRVLDCFTNQGTFALACTRAGAAQVTAVEASAECIASARQNAVRNNLSIDWIEQDVFHFLRAAEKAGPEYDLIILDPPSFTKTKGALRDALRGYRELHVRAFNLLSHNGLLATFSCSHHVNETVFNQTVADALVDARRTARRLRRFEQALDHPILQTVPETEYFKGLLLEMMPGR